VRSSRRNLESPGTKRTFWRLQTKDESQSLALRQWKWGGGKKDSVKTQEKSEQCIDGRGECCPIVALGKTCKSMACIYIKTNHELSTTVGRRH